MFYDLHLNDGADAGETVNHDADQSAIAQTNEIGTLIGIFTLLPAPEAEHNQTCARFRSRTENPGVASLTGFQSTNLMQLCTRVC